MKSITAVFKLYHLIMLAITVVLGVMFWNKAIILAIMLNGVIHLILYCMSLLVEIELQ